MDDPADPHPASRHLSPGATVHRYDHGHQDRQHALPHHDPFLRECYCELSSHECKFNPATAKKSSSVDDTKCRKNTCQPSNGACLMANQPDGTDCDDNNPCTVEDSCAGGLCQPGTWDYDLPGCGCGQDSDCASYNDDDQCTGEWFCNKAEGLCQQNNATVPVSCE